jgi:hypothetical protein
MYYLCTTSKNQLFAASDREILLPYYLPTPTTLAASGRSHYKMTTVPTYLSRFIDRLELPKSYLVRKKINTDAHTFKLVRYRHYRCVLCTLVMPHCGPVVYAVAALWECVARAAATWSAIVGRGGRCVWRRGARG